MREQFNLKNRIQNTIGVVTRAWIGVLFVVLASLATPAYAAPSWCEQWNTYGDIPDQPAVTDNQRFMFHLGFFLTKSDGLRGLIKKHNPTFEEQTLDKIMTCYEENTPQLVERVDNICHQADTSTQDKKVEDSMIGYINWCIEQSTTKA